MNKVPLPLAIVAILITGITTATVSLAAQPAQQPSPSDLVYQVCQASRQSLTIDERGCADLQDQTHIEYLCEEANTLHSNHCWTEKHGTDWSE